eukprot:6472134-Amphidinium_carterae.1
MCTSKCKSEKITEGMDFTMIEVPPITIRRDEDTYAGLIDDRRRFKHTKSAVAFHETQKWVHDQNQIDDTRYVREEYARGTKNRRTSLPLP